MRNAYKHCHIRHPSLRAQRRIYLICMPPSTAPASAVNPQAHTTGT
jgi:hypothetical protein